MKQNSQSEEKPHVLIIHGVLMNALEMFYLAHQLKKHGFIVHAFTYQSVLKTPAQNADLLHQKILKLNLPQLHIVAHSLGGIVTTHLLNKFDDIPDGRVVMLGTPITGSWFARKLKHWPIINKMLANSMKQGLSGKDIPEWKSDRDWGMIAGTFNIGLAMIVGGLPNKGDGTVLLEETKHPKIIEHTTVHKSHTALLFCASTAKLVADFLRYGTFAEKQA